MNEMKSCPMNGFYDCIRNSCGFWAEEEEECAVALIPTAIRLLDDTREGIASLWERKARSERE